MTYSRNFITKTLSAAVITCAVAAIYTVPAAAQIAEGLDCTGCVTSSEIKDKTIKSKDLRNKSVKNKKIADNAVDGQKIADGTVGAADLSGDSVDGTKIQDGSVGNADLADNSVNSAKVQNNSLTANDLGANSVGASEVQGNSIPATDQSNEAGMDYSATGANTNLTAVDVTVRSVTVTAPAAGYVVVNANAYFFGPGGFGRCSITTGNLVDFNQFIAGGTTGGTDFEAFGITRGFFVTAGATTFRLVCDQGGGNVSIADPSMTAMYFPTRY